MLMSSLNASANFQPWEAACGEHRQNEVHGHPADVRVGPFYRDDPREISDIPDTVQRAAREARC
jgi:hypothetical protein